MEATRPFVERPLYEVAGDLESVLAELLEAGGELTDELKEKLDEVGSEFEQKVAQCGLYGVSCERRRDMVRAEVERLKDKAATYEKARQSIRNYLNAQMSVVGIRKVEHALLTVWQQKSSKSVSYQGKWKDGTMHSPTRAEEGPAPEIGDYPVDIPAKFIRLKMTYEIDKKALLEAVENGEELPESVKVAQNTHVRWR